MCAAARRCGDRRDAKLVRDLDSMHVFMPYMLPNRTDNEAVLNETADLTYVMKYLEEKNAAQPEFKYTIFQVICAAFAKMIYMRPKMNRFIIGHRTYQRNDISFTFIVKKKFADDAPETVAVLTIDQDSGVSPLQQFHDKLQAIVYDVRVKNKQDNTTDFMDILKKLPRWLIRILAKCFFMLDYYGKLPKSLADVDPFSSTVFLTNLGSIKLHANYHHLANWSTNSIFVVLSEKTRAPRFHEDGSFEMYDAMDVGITIDERIADGVYFAESLRIMRQLVKEPSLLDLPLSAPIDPDSTAEETAAAR